MARDSALLQRKSSTHGEESVIAVGARCTDSCTRKRIISGQGMLCTVRGIVLVAVRHMCLHLVVMERVEQPMSVALGCCTINRLGATIPVCVAYVVRFSMSWR